MIDEHDGAATATRIPADRPGAREYAAPGRGSHRHPTPAVQGR